MRCAGVDLEVFILIVVLLLLLLPLLSLVKNSHKMVGAGVISN